MAVSQKLIEESVEAVCGAIRKGLWEIGSCAPDGRSPGTIEFIGMEIRDKFPDLVEAVREVAEGLESIAEAIREHGGAK